MCFEPLPINHRLHHGHGLVDAGQVLAIQGVQAHLRGEGLGAALAAKEDDPFVKDGQAADLHRPGSAHEGVGGDAVEVAHVYGIKATVEADGLHIGGDVQQLSLASLHAAGPVQSALGALGEINAKILDAILVSTSVHDLPGVYTDSLADAGGIANGAGHDLFRHCWLPPE
ncbi:hypothetical protein [Vermiculatibacterium agrestimuris]|uniref:hypothetical protein n=1 Tax=Vermiculatibacterium agrestimuris TaxID=2941519 RepID=UPI00203BB65B|nr:hypothetical protein [Vermiculatibacterium agrestimuris]